MDVRAIGKSFANLTAEQQATAQIKLTMRIDSKAGLIQASNAILFVPADHSQDTDSDKSVTGRLKGLFGGSSKDSSDKTGDNVDSQIEEIVEDEKETGSKRVAAVDKKIALSFSETALGVKPMPADVKRKAKLR